MLKNILKKLLPISIYNFIRMRPRLLIVSESLKRKIAYINKAAWQQDPDYRGDNSGALRKYGHMVDKGLQSPNREAGHSLPIAMRLNELLDLKERECASAEWAQEILSLHRDLQQDRIADGYSNFSFIKDNDITSEQLLHLFKERRTLRHFQEHKTPSLADITKILEATIWAPSSCNRQTIVNYFTLNEELARQCTKQNKGATAISGKHAFVSVCYDTRSYHLPQESLTGMIDATLGFQNALLMVHALGLGACVLNWSHADKNENDTLRYLLNIPEHCEIAFNVIIGIPNGGAPAPGKKNTLEYIVER
ncbi:nitroreductase family protein [Colwellia sp. MB3u-70]|uniref:nitroreductase family protein n=1 Tax=unclassified Colwellia TaxID=196834 RepID=UPI0015F72A2A|nr:MULTISPECIES: nitroreductase family protein [unclassified Colwellia]MBA6292581.1 nitroreductase family protein [Colwellia sp. MB3u-8]MBA6307376.1 nitroreductase family protein [Colwellia sp. MB3u-70]